MTGRGNLELVAHLFGQDKRSAYANAARVLGQLGLTEAADRLARTLLVPKTSSTSRDLGVLVDQPAQTIDP